ncbi:general secretion pathway protein GspB [uncultured Shewanella sp.]|uniref:general secretion pathway protein GspB n=1 Tax=uncultured Shewanella sp. TaxID=173975 RepID=UPI00260AEC27|nr:general secretion pathway protein GspB [uncultured Shewanella sp.]
MSILLEAVTRSKQQELESDLDPVLTPRAQYDDFTKPKKNILMLSLIIIILSLLIVIVWLARDHFTSGNVHTTQVSVDALTVKTRNSEPLSGVAHDLNSHRGEQRGSASGGGEQVKLAGKVALPLAVALPVKPVDIENSYSQAEAVPQNRARVVEVAKQPTEVSPAMDEEPIILGANSNQRGREVLESLKSQVDAAASELGMDNSSTEPVAPGQKNEYQSKNKLLAAFEAALKEVEVEKSVASSVTEPKLDPIPVPKQDNLPKYGQLPAGLQLQVPEFNIHAHVYASDPGNRWLNVDGAELQQGDMISGKLEIIEIRPRDVVLAIEGTQFKVPAI